MLKNALLISVLVLGFGLPAFAATILFPSGGGTGQSFLPAGGLLVGNGLAPILATTSPTIGSLTATSTATSTFAGSVRSSCFSIDGLTCISFPSLPLSVANGGTGATTATGATTNLQFLFATSTNPVANAVARSDTYKMADWVSVKDFGAIGDGTTDDTISIQNAFNYASTTLNHLGTVYFPAGTYKVSATLKAESSVQLDPTAIVRASASMTDLLQVGLNSLNGTFRQGTANAPNPNPFALTLSGGILDGNDLVTNAVFHIQNTLGANVQYMTVYNAPLYGFEIEGIGTNLSDVMVARSLGTNTPAGSVGIYINGSDGHLTDDYVSYGQTGLYISGAGTYAENVHVYDHNLQMITGIKVDSSENTIRGCETDKPNLYGVYDSGNYNTYVGCRIRLKDPLASNTTYAFYFPTSASHHYFTVLGDVVNGEDTALFKTDIAASSTATVYKYGNIFSDVQTPSGIGLLGDATGTPAMPYFSFGAAPSSGMYLAATVTPELGLSVGGTNVLDLKTGTSTFSSGLVTPSLSIGSLSGILKAVSGYVTASLVNLATDVTGTLPVANGGTASTTLGGILAGSGTAAVKSAVIGSGLAFDGTTLSATGGSGSGTVATSTPLVSGQVDFSTGVNTIGNSANFLWDTVNNLFRVVGNASTTQLTTTGSTYLAISGGNVGIGTTTAAATLVVNGPAAQDLFRIGTSTAQNMLKFDQNGTLTVDNTGIASQAGLSVRSLDASVTTGNATLAVNLVNTSNTSNNYSMFGFRTFSTTGVEQVEAKFGAQFTDHTQGAQSAGFVWTTRSGGSLTDKMYLSPAGLLGIGTTTPWAPLSVSTTSQNAGTLPLFVVASTTNATLFSVLGNGFVGINGIPNPAVSLDIMGVNGTNNTTMQLTNYGGSTAFAAQRADGTQASPTATLAAENLFNFGARGYSASGFSSATRAQILFNADEDFTNTAQGTNISFTTTKNTTTTKREQLRITSGGQLLVGTTTSTALLEARARYGDINTELFTISSSTNSANTAFTSFLTVLGNGRVGIGSTTPLNLLDIVASDSGTTLTNSSAAMEAVVNTNTAANDFSDLAFSTNDSAGARVNVAKISGVFTSHTAGAVSSDLAFLTTNAGTAAERVRITGAGVLRVAGLATAAGTFLAADPSGNIIATTSPSGSGTVTNIATNATLTGGPITTTGTLGLNLANSNNWTALQNFNTPGLAVNVAATSWYGIGSSLLAYASSTNQSTIFGIGAGGTNATTSASLANNSVFGFIAGNAITSGTGNTLIGSNAGKLVTTSSNIVAVGQSAANAATTASGGSISIGNSSLVLGQNDISIGINAGQGSATGAGNIAIGGGTRIFSSSDSGQLNIGNAFFGTGMYSAGNASAAVALNGAFSVGSTSPFASLSVHALNGSTVTNLFAVASSTASATTTLFLIDNTGHVVTGSPKGSLTSCGTTNSLNGNDVSGTIMLTGTLVTACTLTFANPTPASQNLSCTASDASTAIFANVTATSSTAVTFGLSGTVSAATIFYHCDRNINN